VTRQPGEGAFEGMRRARGRLQTSAGRLSMSGAAVVALAFGFAGDMRSAGEQPRDFRSEVEVVSVTATVLDADGGYVDGLSLGDFVLRENGIPQTITHFDRERRPVSLGIALDLSDSMRGDRIVEAERALVALLDEGLDARDQVFLSTFNHRPKRVSGWTSPPAALGEALRGLRPTGGTALYDAVADALPALPSGEHAKRALLLISDGADTASDADARSVRDLIRRHDALIYAIGIDTPRARRINDPVDGVALRQMSDESGGFTAIAHDVAQLVTAATHVADELGRQYLIGYTPSEPPDGHYRTIRLRIEGHDDYMVRARRGYISVPPEDR